MVKISGGFLIAIEGIDGAGKTTQVNELKKRLENFGFKTVVLKEPTQSEFGEIIKKMTLHNIDHFRNPIKESKWFIEDRKIDVKKNIKPNLDKGNVVIMDRYYYSNMAYQGVLGLDSEIIKEENEKIAPIPNIVIILDVSPKVGIERIIHKREEKTNNYEKLDYLTKVREKFIDMLKYPNVKLVNGDGNMDKEEITEDILKEIKKALNGRIDEVSHNEDRCIDYAKPIENDADFVNKYKKLLENKKSPLLKA